MPDSLDLAAIEARWQPVPEPRPFTTGGAGGSPSPMAAAVTGNHGGGWKVGGGGGGGSTAATHNRAAKDIAALINRIRELEAEKVWVVLSHCFDDVRVEGVYTNRTQAEYAWPETDENGFSTGYQIIEQEVADA